MASHFGDVKGDVKEEDSRGQSVLVLPIDGVLDLHTFDPRDIENLLQDYMEACLKASILDIRIIHGKGTGTMRNRVYRFLSRHHAVESFKQAPEEAGGWGAVLVHLRRNRKIV